MFKEETNEGTAWKIRSAMMRTIQGGGTAADASTTKIKVEASPEKQEHLDAMGMMLKVMRTKGVPYGTLKPEWGPPESRILHKEYGKRAILLATFKADQWQIQESQWQIITKNKDATAKELLQDLRSL